MNNEPGVKDVEARLLKERKRRRKSGDVVYPVEYTSEVMDLDNWSQMFLRKLCGSLTMLQFAKPPSLVLDLGCGGGLWAIEAAKEWKNAKIYGFDMKIIQPRLDFVDPSIASRLKWIHGDLLEGLPFSTNRFDFVRVSGVGLGIPEDEWQFVLEEIARVLKPGCPLEIIEEDPIFPCSRPPKSRSSPPSTSFPGIQPGPSTNISPVTWSASLVSRSKSFENWSTYTMRRTLTEKAPTREALKTQLSSVLERRFDVRDHSRLKACWEAMLTNRFINSQLIDVLPFYLSSSFSNVQSHACLQIPLPSKQGEGDPVSLRNNQILDPTLCLGLRIHSGWTSSESNPTGTTPPCGQIIRAWACMHLAKSVKTVMACKEAMWAEWEKLYGENRALPPITRTPRPKEFPKHDTQCVRSETRDEFERAWCNWERDMTERIGARSVTRGQFAWHEPLYERRGDRRMRPLSQDSGIVVQNESAAEPDPPELCRNIRGFACWKPS